MKRLVFAIVLAAATVTACSRIIELTPDAGPGFDGRGSGSAVIDAAGFDAAFDAPPDAS